MAIYCIADTHFFHKEIIDICGRPFANCNEMNETLIQKWNDIVDVDDIVYVVGDFAIAPLEKIEKLLLRLNGRKYLVMGNHDNNTVGQYYSIGFERVYDKPVIIDDFWMVSHEPLFVNEAMPYVNIFGHVHNSPLYRDYSKKHFCVSAERINYTPVLFETIKEVIKKEYAE